ncbi:MAG: hypothetical protein WCR30_03715 [Clostridia bacterium]
MNQFFTADTHFGSSRIGNRPFKSINEMDKTIIKNWNETVNDESLVYHLGDFGNFETIKKLKGKIVLIVGNHEEKEIETNFGGDFDAFKNHLLKLGFVDVILTGCYIDNPFFGEKIYLTHKPLNCKKSCFNFFGHLHNFCLVKKFGINVGTDNYFFKPASEEELLIYKNSIQNHFDNNFFCGIQDLKD